MNRHQSVRTVLLPQAKDSKLGAFIRMEDEQVRHYHKVLRLEWGTPVRVVDGIGGVYSAFMHQENKSGGVLIQNRLEKIEPQKDLELVICLSKNNTMDALVEKAVECGVTAILPVVSSRSVVRPDPKETDKYVKRWQKIMDEAVEQSERTWRALVERPISWTSFVKIAGEKKHKYFAFVSEVRNNSESSLAESFKLMQKAASGPIRIMIGPEGGFSQEEITQMLDAGFETGSLGENVLRVETAVVSALTMAQLARKFK